ncbi:MAG TPA: hypothetical protein VN040_09570 [Pseudosphingobacterium sp.]|nr:hypothetical protein [Pseudosphingobacterium sp.]
MRISYKRDLFEEIKIKFVLQGFRIVGQDQSQPWGGSLLNDESQSMEFANIYFKNWSQKIQQSSLPVRPNILVLAPQQAIAWQYHLRRIELWQVLVGEGGVVISDNDEESELLVKQPNELIELNSGKRHCLVGLKDWTVIAQIWYHLDVEQPSDDMDVVKLKHTHHFFDREYPSPNYLYNK